MFPKIVVPPKSSILIGFSIVNHPFWGTTIFGNTHILDIQTHGEDRYEGTSLNSHLLRCDFWLLGVPNSHLQTPGMTGGWLGCQGYRWMKRLEGHIFFSAPPPPPPHTCLMPFLAASKERFTQSA